MTDSMHAPPSHAEPIYRWYKRAQIDYVEQYIRLYISYNAWYREVTGTVNDRQALAQLKKRAIIWEDYRTGKSMQSLTLYMERLVDLLLKEPLGKTLHWSGSIEHINDWRALIEFWYQVRCMLVHGTPVPVRYVWLAYETLDIFMGEIIDRMQKALDNYLPSSTIEATSGNMGGKYTELQDKLYAKYFTSPDLWQVDMRHVEDV